MKIGEEKNKKAQVSVFVIIGIILIFAIIVLFFLFRTPKVKISAEEPGVYISFCMMEGVEEAENLLLRQGGEITPENYHMHNDEKVDYLCYTKQNYDKCVTQKPVFMDYLNKEIEDYLSPIAEECYNTLRSELEKDGFIISMAEQKIVSEISVKGIEVTAQREITIKGESAKTFKEFSVVFPTPIYNLALIAERIGGEEAERCDFDIIDYMIKYPDFEIEKMVYGDGVKAYTIIDKKTSKKLNIAIRSCVLPPEFE